MIGNDVVDLDDPEARPETLHPRFDGRVFSARECRLIDGHRDSSEMRWTLWACKESAYKLIKRQHPSTVFSQRAFSVVLQGPDTARVRHAVCSVDVNVFRHARALHAVATCPGTDAEKVISAVAKSVGDPSEDVRELARRHLARVLDCRPVDIDFVSDRDRIPSMSVAGSTSRLPISFSHHGMYVAFACWLEVANGGEPASKLCA